MKIGFACDHAAVDKNAASCKQTAQKSNKDSLHRFFHLLLFSFPEEHAALSFGMVYCNPLPCKKQDTIEA